MDPLSGLGLAANVIQFVGFASDLISRTSEISASATGTSSQITTLDTVYRQLQTLSQELERASQRDKRLEIVSNRPEIIDRVFAINDLSRSCKEDCDKLIEIVQTLIGNVNTSGAKRRWKSFRLALKSVWKAQELAALEQRLHYTQTSLVLQVCASMSYWQDLYQRQLRDTLAERMQLDVQNSAKLDSMKHALEALGSCTVRAAGEPGDAAEDIAALAGHMSQLTLSKTSVAKEHAILKSLDFPCLPARHSSIPEAHSKTFRWVFDDPPRLTQPEVPRTGISRLLTWLRHGDGIFWISGKPGAGKSTLMKYITDHPNTMTALSAWAYPNSIVVARHFFWCAGTPVQKSQEGLLRTLLHDIFRQKPDLIEPACLERWGKSPEHLGRQAWSMAELCLALQRIAKSSATLSTMFCFFIDGLDEYEGDHLDFCRSTLNNLASSPHIKLCVSSRPWNVFEDALGKDDDRKVYVQDLTRNDIRAFAEQRLQDHPRWNDLDVQPERLVWLVDEIANRAAGVFLWVFLVTRDLRCGLTEYDSFKDLQRRLESIPDDLGVFFRQILDSVHPFYNSKMAKSLQVALAVRQPAPSAVYGFIDDEYDDSDYSIRLLLGPFPTEKTRARRKQIARRLSGRCRGLLEVNKSTNCVEFLHRTVMDFLRTGEMSRYLQNMAPAHFDVNLSLVKAFLAYIKTTQFPEFVDRTEFAHSTASALTSAIQEALFHAIEVDDDDATSDSLDTAHVVDDLVDELDRCVPEMNRTGQSRLNVWGIDTNPVCLFVREHVIQAGMVGYVNRTLLRAQMQQGGGAGYRYFSDFEKPVLAYVIPAALADIRNGGREFASSKKRSRRREMLHCLLKHGSDANAVYVTSFGAYTCPWDDFLDARVLGANGNLHDVASYVEMLALLLQHGADPNSPKAREWLNGHFFPQCFGKLPPTAQTMYLQILDAFIAAGLDIVGTGSVLWSVLSQLAKKTSSSSQPVIPDTDSAVLTAAALLPSSQSLFLLKVAKRLFRAAARKVAEDGRPGSMQPYLSAIEGAFPPEIYSQLCGEFGVTGVPVLATSGMSPVSIEVVRMKRSLEEEEGKASAKRNRAI